KAIVSNPYHGKPFYIIIHEKKDLQLTNVILRRMITKDKRPYPEVNTTVFWTNPKSQETRFCWSLPHQSSFLGYLINPDDYDPEQISDIKAFQAENMEHFGFKKVGVAKDKSPIIRPIQGFKDRKLRQKRSRPE
ncbi:MAG: hypothetical protein KAS32_29290, partial [Candidatus Peribacteraceae bacterium]|nr:hypothetical protein [Candidatus Peribacteraceae bacterium]